jgi:hypothetical protein
MLDTRHPLQTEVISHVLLCTVLESKCTSESSAYLKKKKKDERGKEGICTLPRFHGLGGALVRWPGVLELVLVIMIDTC